MPVQKPVEAQVLRVIDTLLYVGRAHVIDHHGGRQRGEKILKLGQVAHFEINDDVPPKLVHARRDALQHIGRREIDQALEEIEAHAAHAGFVHPLQLIVGHLLADKGDTLGAALGTVERIDHRAVVLGVAGRLDNDVVVEAEKVAQREQLLLRRVARCVFALRRVGKFALRAEDVTMRIDRAQRRFVFRFRRIGMERNVPGTHRH